MARRLPETLTGFAVIIVAAVFLVYALGRTGAVTTGGYTLQAQFSSIGGLAVGVRREDRRRRRRPCRR